MNSGNEVRLGVIGLGNIARQHIDNVSNSLVAGCGISALCSRQACELAEQIGVPHFSDYRELIDSGLCDAVLIATPTSSHFEIGSAALKESCVSCFSE